MIKVVNCRRESYDVYIGRPSIWGNPFRIKYDGTREEVINKYERWLLKNNSLMIRLGELKDKRLGCWCKPFPCHGDVLVKLIEQKLKNESQ